MQKKNVKMRQFYNLLFRKLENCVCKTQVMPPCPKPVLTPYPILTHDPQHIQSILETNVWNVKVKIAVILTKIIFWCATKHMHIFNMLSIAVLSFKMNAWKPWEELITQSYYFLMKPNLKIVKVQNAVSLSKMIFLPAKRYMHIFNILIASVQSFKLIAWKLWEELITQTCYPILKPNLKIV